MKKTKRSMLNIVTSIIPSFILIIIGFLKFKFFINVYGDDLNGIVQLITQIYAYLSLAELGFGAATNVKLYKYFQKNDEEKITKVFNESKSLYFKSGLFIFVAGILISFVLPLFIKNNSVATYYTISIMTLYAIDFLADYLYGLPYRNLLIVNENIYVINLVKTTQQIIFKIVELILILNHVNLLIIISLSVIANIIGSFFLVKIAKKKYSFLKKYKGRDKTVTKSVKDIVVNNVSDIVNEKTDSIVIANQLGLKDTSIYSMYNLIINYMYMFILNFVTGVKGSMGAMLNNDKVINDEKYSIYKQFIAIMNYITIVCAITFSVSASSFMDIFINNDYGVGLYVGILFGLVLWLNTMLKSLHVVVETKGYYKNIKWISLIQAISNIALSFLLVNKFGILGVLFATAITSMLMTIPAKVKVAFNEFKHSPTYFYMLTIVTFISSFIIILIINKLNVYGNVANLLQWFGITAIIFIVICIIMFIILYLIFKDFRDVISRVLNNKFVFKIKRWILSKVAYVNYKLNIKNKGINVYSIEKTIDDIIKNKASLVRYGDGEMDIINGKSLKFQDYTPELANKLSQILSLKSDDKFFIAVPEIFNSLDIFTKDEKEFWAISLLKTSKDWFSFCEGDYYNAFLSRPYLRYKDKSNSDKIFKKIKKIYKDKNVILVEGEFSRLGVGNDLFDGVKSIKRILCPNKNAYSAYNKILDVVCQQNKDNLILISLGPTAKVLVYELYQKGYQAIDLGHIDLEYEWFLRKETKKVKIENKYVNEVDDGEENQELNDEKYLSQILININKEDKND